MRSPFFCVLELINRRLKVKIFFDEINETVCIGGVPDADVFLRGTRRRNENFRRAARKVERPRCEVENRPRYRGKPQGRFLDKIRQKSGRFEGGTRAPRIRFRRADNGTCRSAGQRRARGRRKIRENAEARVGGSFQRRDNIHTLEILRTAARSIPLRKGRSLYAVPSRARKNARNVPRARPHSQNALPFVVLLPMVLPRLG